MVIIPPSKPQYPSLSTVAFPSPRWLTLKTELERGGPGGELLSRNSNAVLHIRENKITDSIRLSSIWKTAKGFRFSRYFYYYVEGGPPPCETMSKTGSSPQSLWPRRRRPRLVGLAVVGGASRFRWRPGEVEHDDAASDDDDERMFRHGVRQLLIKWNKGFWFAFFQRSCIFYDFLLMRSGSANFLVTESSPRTTHSGGKFATNN